MNELNTESTPILDSIEGDTAGEIRREVLDLVCKTADADVCIFFKYAIAEEERYLTTTEGVGEAQVVEQFADFTDERLTSEPFWDPRYPPKEALQQFEVQHFDPERDDEVDDEPVLRDLYAPLDVRSQISALLYDGTQFLGWIGALRLGSDAEIFDAEARDRLDDLTDRLTDALRRAEERERNEIGDEPGRLLIRPETGTVDCATGNAHEWLNTSRMDVLANVVDSVGPKDSFPVTVFVEGFRVWVRPMDGNLGRRYLATIDYASSPEISPKAALTPRQREVASYAAAGATNREIADTLDISPDTVSDHLTETYQRLGIANRVELARVLADSEL